MSTVNAAGGDLLCNKRIEATFFEEFDGLTFFPFDSQTLTLTFVITCANEGITPVKLVIADDCQCSLVDQARCCANQGAPSHLQRAAATWPQPVAAVDDAGCLQCTVFVEYRRECPPGSDESECV
eukprot:6581799-Prymnesium_polylepis.2